MKEVQHEKKKTAPSSNLILNFNIRNLRGFDDFSRSPQRPRNLFNFDCGWRQVRPVFKFDAEVEGRRSKVIL